MAGLFLCANFRKKDMTATNREPVSESDRAGSAEDDATIAFIRLLARDVIRLLKERQQQLQSGTDPLRNRTGSVLQDHCRK